MLYQNFVAVVAVVSKNYVRKSIAMPFYARNAKYARKRLCKPVSPSLQVTCVGLANHLILVIKNTLPFGQQSVIKGRFLVPSRMYDRKTVRIRSDVSSWENDIFSGYPHGYPGICQVKAT